MSKLFKYKIPILIINLNTKEIFKKGITEKENHLGIGLWEVKQILKRNNNVNLITENNDLYFKQCLEIYY